MPVVGSAVAGEGPSDLPSGVAQSKAATGVAESVSVVGGWSGRSGRWRVERGIGNRRDCDGVARRRGRDWSAAGVECCGKGGGESRVGSAAAVTSLCRKGCEFVEPDGCCQRPRVRNLRAGKNRLLPAKSIGGVACSLIGANGCGAIGTRLRRFCRRLARSPLTMASAPGSLRRVASARWRLRACKTTEWPCSTNSYAAIRSYLIYLCVPFSAGVSANSALFFRDQRLKSSLKRGAGFS